MKYEVFISYRHGGIDEKVAVRAHSEIERYRIPSGIAKRIGKKKVGRVFRDADELQASSDLSAVIREALDEARWLIVVATPRYGESPWCLEEIEYFIREKDREHIIVLLVEGEPQDVFPKALTEVERDGEMVSIEPLAVDVRGDSDRSILKNLHKERFRFLSSILSVDYDDLRQRQRERKIRRISAIAIVAFMILAGVLGVIIHKNIQLNTAYEALDDSMQQTLRGESYYLAEYSDEAYKNGDKKTALMLALQALPADLSAPDRPYVPEMMQYLTQALGVYDYSVGYKASAFFDTGEKTSGVKTGISEDKSRLMVETYADSAGNLKEREVSVLSVRDGRELCRYPMASLSGTYYHASSKGAYLTKDGKRLIYIAPEGLRCVEVDTGKELFTGKTASELVVGEEEGVIVTIDYDSGQLNTYAADGESVIDCEIGKEMNYTLGCVSPQEKTVTIAANTEEIFGILSIELSSGQSGFYSMPGLCSDVRYLDENTLCFLLMDQQDGLKHIVKYDMVKDDQGYLCNTDWDIHSMTITKEKTCYYYHANTVYEVDGASKKGRKIWERVFSSGIVSIAAQDGMVAVSCQDGSVYFFEEKTKRLINSQSGNNEPYNALYVDLETAILSDYFGKNIRVYSKIDNTDRGAKSLALMSSSKENSFDLLKQIPDRWYTCSTDSDRFVMGFHNGAEDRIAEFDATEYKVLSDVSLEELGMSSFENKTIEQKNRDTVSVHDYDFNSTGLYTSDSLKKIMSIKEDSYYFYNESGDTVCVSDSSSKKTDPSVIRYDVSTGKKNTEEKLRSGCDRGIIVGDGVVSNDGKTIWIGGGTQDEKIDDAVLYAYNEARGLIFYRNVSGDRWFVYDMKSQKNVCEGEAGVYSCTTFFGNNRYLLNDYMTVYDMDTWKPVLDLGKITNRVYGVQTTDDLPYFVVWCRESETDSNGRSGGADVAYLYDKTGSGGIVGTIPNFVTLASDGEAIVFDGESSLYRFPLLTADEIKTMAEQTVGDADFTQEQKERYHLYGNK